MGLHRGIWSARDATIDSSCMDGSDADASAAVDAALECNENIEMNL